MSKNYRPQESYQITSHIAVILVVLILFLAVGYFFFIGQPGEQARHMEELDELVSSRALWQSRRPVSYQYVVDRVCNCPDEDDRAYLVIVRDGQQSAQFPIPVESSTGILITAPPRPVWIDEIFAVVELALQENADIDARYDRSWGYPRTVIIGPAEQYEIRDFEVAESR